MPSPQLRRIAFACFHLVVVLILFYWIANLNSADIESARRTVQSLITLEATLLGFLLAILAFSMTMTFSQMQRLEPFRLSLLSSMRELGEIGLKLGDLSGRYREIFDTEGKLPAGLKYNQVRHMRDRDLIADLNALAGLARQHEAGREDGPAGSPLELDTIGFFRIACAVLLSDACLALGTTDPVARLSRKLRELEVSHNIVSIVNNVYALRRAARRSLPLFMFLLILSWLASTVYLSTLSRASFNHLMYGLIVAPAFPIAYGFGYYSYQILSRFFQ